MPCNISDIAETLNTIEDLCVSNSNATLLCTSRVHRPKAQSLREVKRQRAPRTLTTLIDTGALTSDFVSVRTARQLVDEEGLSIVPTTHTINTALRLARPYQCQGRIQFSIVIFNELTKQSEVIDLDALIIDTGYHLIVGRPSIVKHQLLKKMHDQILFGVQSRKVDMQGVPRTALLQRLHGAMNLLDTPCSCTGPLGDLEEDDRSALSSEGVLSNAVNVMTDTEGGCELRPYVVCSVSEISASRYPPQCLEENLRPDSGTCPPQDYPSDSEEEDTEWLATLTSHPTYTTMDSAVLSAIQVNPSKGRATRDKPRLTGGKRRTRRSSGSKELSQAKSLRKRL